MCIYMYTYMSLSLSLYIYIYTYICIHIYVYIHTSSFSFSREWKKRKNGKRERCYQIPQHIEYIDKHICVCTYIFVTCIYKRTHIRYLYWPGVPGLSVINKHLSHHICYVYMYIHEHTFIRMSCLCIELVCVLTCFAHVSRYSCDTDLNRPVARRFWGSSCPVTATLQFHRPGVPMTHFQHPSA